MLEKELLSVDHSFTESRPHELSSEMREYLKFDCPPSPQTKIDTIIVLGTSKKKNPALFAMRVRNALEYADVFPHAGVIFSGKQAHGNNALPEESGDNYIEAAVMATEAISLGLDPKRIRLETKAIHTKDNVYHSLDMVPSQANSVLFVSSGYHARRVDLYIRKLKDTGKFPKDDLKYFIVDADVREDAAGVVLVPEQVKRKHASMLYEAVRITTYREKGDL